VRAVVIDLRGGRPNVMRDPRRVVLLSVGIWTLWQSCPDVGAGRLLGLRDPGPLRQQGVEAVGASPISSTVRTDGAVWVGSSAPNVVEVLCISR